MVQTSLKMATVGTQLPDKVSSLEYKEITVKSYEKKQGIK